MQRSVLALALCTELRSVRAFVSQHALAAWPRSRRRRGAASPAPRRSPDGARAAASKAAPRRACRARAREEGARPRRRARRARAFALGGGVGLVDIGANLQTRGRYAGARRLPRGRGRRHARRAAGCDVAGARRAGALRSGGAREGGGGGDDDNGGERRGVPRLPRRACTRDATKWDAQTARRSARARALTGVRASASAASTTTACSRRATCAAARSRNSRRRARPAALRARARRADKGEPLGAYADALAILAKFDGGGGRGGACTASGNEAELARCSARRVRRLHWLSASRSGRDDRRAARSASRAESRRSPRAVLIETDAPFMSPDKQFLPTATAKAMGLRGEERAVRHARGRARTRRRLATAPSPEEVGARRPPPRSGLTCTLPTSASRAGAPSARRGRDGVGRRRRA